MNKRIVFILFLFSAIFATGFFWPSEPTESDLEKIITEALAPVSLNEIKVENLEILGYEGRWAKARIVIFGEKSIEYFFWESGEWKHCNLIGGMNLENAKALKVPEALWPTPEESETQKKQEDGLATTPSEQGD